MGWLAARKLCIDVPADFQLDSSEAYDWISSQGRRWFDSLKRRGLIPEDRTLDELKGLSGETLHFFILSWDGKFVSGPGFMVIWVQLSRLKDGRICFRFDS